MSNTNTLKNTEYTKITATSKTQMNGLPISMASLHIFPWFYCRSDYINYISAHRINVKQTEAIKLSQHTIKSGIMCCKHCYRVLR